MIPSDVTIELNHRDGVYSPGDSFRAEIFVADYDASDVEAIECSVLWQTVGKGETDLSVRHFVRDESLATPMPDAPLTRINCDLPASPLSYDGVIVKVVWCVRVRVFQKGDYQFIVDKPFRVGAVAAPAPVEE